MKDIVLDLGLEEYQLSDKNGKVRAVVEFNPTDMYFVERLSNVFERMEGLQDKYKGQIEAAKDGVSAFNVARKIDADMHKIVDDLFGEKGITEKIYGKMSLYALGANQIPVWANLLLPIMDEVDGAVKAAQKESSPKLQEYLNKYNY